MKRIKRLEPKAKYIDAYNGYYQRVIVPIDLGDVINKINEIVDAYNYYHIEGGDLIGDPKDIATGNSPEIKFKKK